MTAPRRSPRRAPRGGRATPKAPAPRQAQATHPLAAALAPPRSLRHVDRGGRPLGRQPANPPVSRRSGHR